jgi:S-adenosylmethionine-diacylglycerol 3-amino-3-carboxypropyl transferase
MTTQLIANAAPGRDTLDDVPLSASVASFWRRCLVATQSWQDPEADLAALQLPLGSTIVTASSGCNALSYLTAQPAQIYAVDRNEAHLALLKLRLTGLRAFSSYEEFWQFFGEAASPANARLYAERLRPLLDTATRAYWDGCSILGRSRHRYFTDGFHRHGFIGRAIGIAHLVAHIAGIDCEALLTAPPDGPKRPDALNRLNRLFHSAPMRWLAGSTASLFRLGLLPRPLKGSAHLEELLLQRLLRLINAQDSGSNYFAWQVLRRSYQGPGDRCLPSYLQRRQFTTMRNGAGVVIPVCADLTRFLDSLPAREVDAIALQDAQDWMTSSDITALWNAIDRVGSERVCVIFRTAGTSSPLASNMLAASTGVWQRDEERSAIGSELDRCGLYGGFHCYVRG